MRTYIHTRRGIGKAVDGISFTLSAGETLGLVGESGSGKSIACLSLLRLNPSPASRIVNGEVLLNGRDLLKLPSSEMEEVRGREIAMILQDPMTALNPVLRLRTQLGEPLKRHLGLRRRALRDRAVSLLTQLRIPDAGARLRSYPHQLSGGMRQRVVGAIALSCAPSVLLADEPTTSLDVTIQASFLRLLRRLQRENGTAVLFVTHDFGIVGQMCDRVAVMYAGKIVETAPTEALLSNPAHPYTAALLQSVPSVTGALDRLPTIPGQPPSVYETHAGCPFAARCPSAHDRCLDGFPDETEIAPNHVVACRLYEN